MNKFLNFIKENIFGIFIALLLLLFLIFSIIMEIDLAKKNTFELEEKCFNFYKKNNYVLEQCKQFKNKLEG